MALSLRRASTGPPPALRAASHAPLFHDLAQRLVETERLIVLDLGAASTEMLSLLGRARCRVEIVDLGYFGGIDQLNIRESDVSLADRADALVPDPQPGEAFDLVFCWDLLNYLPLDALSALMDAIARRARPGALAHALIYYAEREMPDRPARFVPTPDGDELINDSASRTTIAAPRYSPEDMDKGMGRFALDRARLLSNGMQEFLFRL